MKEREKEREREKDLLCNGFSPLSFSPPWLDEGFGKQRLWQVSGQRRSCSAVSPGWQKGGRAGGQRGILGWQAGELGRSHSTASPYYFFSPSWQLLYPFPYPFHSLSFSPIQQPIFYLLPIANNIVYLFCSFILSFSPLCRLKHLTPFSSSPFSPHNYRMR